MGDRHVKSLTLVPKTRKTERNAWAREMKNKTMAYTG